jgi:hypothetical protein
MLVSIHSSSVWTERNSCINTCLHASIHASEKPTCIDTNMTLYRYKRVKTVLSINFHSFIHQTIKTSSSPHAKPHKNPHSQFSISLKTQPKFTKFGPKPLQIHCSFTFLHQYCGSSIQNLHIQHKGFQFGFVSYPNFAPYFYYSHFAIFQILF